MSYSNNLNILVADDDAVSRQMVADMLSVRGFKVYQAIDGGTAIKVLEERPIDLAIVAHHMSPHTGIEFAKHAVLNGHDIGIVMLTDDPSTDLLLEAGKYEIQQVIKKPVDPDRLVGAVRRVLRVRGKNPDAIGAGIEPVFTPEQLMKRVIALAYQNARSNMGGPFAALVADSEGHVIGEGANNVRALCDPTAHAEVLAIRRATDKLNKTDLSGCVIYCSSEPTMMGEALIISTGIDKVYYGLSHYEIGAVRVIENEKGIIGEMQKPLAQRSVVHEQLMHDEALDMFVTWEKRRQRERG